MHVGASQNQWSNVAKPRAIVGHHGHLRGRVAGHDLGVLLDLRLAAELDGQHADEVGHETVHRRQPAGSRGALTDFSASSLKRFCVVEEPEQLGVDVREFLARVGVRRVHVGRHAVGDDPVRRLVFRPLRHRVRQLLADDALERGDLSRFVQTTQQVVERPVLEHHHDHVVQGVLAGRAAHQYLRTPATAADPAHDAVDPRGPVLVSRSACPDLVHRREVCWGRRHLRRMSAECWRRARRRRRAVDEAPPTPSCTTRAGHASRPPQRKSSPPTAASRSPVLARRSRLGARPRQQGPRHRSRRLHPPLVQRHQVRSPTHGHLRGPRHPLGAICRYPIAGRPPPRSLEKPILTAARAALPASCSHRVSRDSHRRASRQPSTVTPTRARRPRTRPVRVTRRIATRPSSRPVAD